MRFFSIIGSIVSLCGATFGCICDVPPPPCVQYWRTDTVFVGTVKRIFRDTTPEWDKVEVEVNEPFRNMNFSIAQTDNWGSSCSHRFSSGEKYLFYGTFAKDEQSIFGAGLCSRTRLITRASKDLDFLRAVASGRSTFWIWGTITTSGRDTPIKGVRAQVLGAKNKKFVGVSDEEGDLFIDVGKPGKYTLRVYLPPGTEDVNYTFRNDAELTKDNWKQIRGGKMGKKPYLDYVLDVGANKCGWFDVAARVSSKVS